MPISRWVGVAVVLFLIVLGGGFLATFIQKTRYDANLRGSQNNLRQLALFAAHEADPKALPVGIAIPHEIPAATIVLPGVAPEDRLSWIVPVLPGVDQRHNPVHQLLEEIARDKPWSAAPNQVAAKTRLNVVLCPENTPRVDPELPAMTCYVGIAGLGLDAATLALPADGPTPPRAGAFRYDAPTPFPRISRGLSQTLLMAETAKDPGPWLRGGKATTRGLDDSSNRLPLIGMGGQFGGYFVTGANFALCDGSVRMFSPQTTPDVLFKLATISGSDRNDVPD